MITVIPAPAAVLALWAEDVPGHELDRPLRPGERVSLHLRATDAVGNPVRATAMTIDVVAGDGSLGSGRLLSMALVADVNGLASVDLAVNPFGTRDVRLQAVNGALVSDILLIEVIGPPVTVARPGPGGHAPSATATT